MNKAVMISINPKWCELIANGKKTVEVRKSKPKLEPPFKVYIYCTKAIEHFFHGGICETFDDLYRMPSGEIKFGYSGELMCCNQPYDDSNFLNGKVIGEFVCDRIYNIKLEHDYETGSVSWECGYYAEEDCLSEEQFDAYLIKKGFGYGWHISDLKIYEKPLNLNDFHKCGAASMDDLLNSEELCRYCSDTDYGDLKCCGTPSGPVMCEGRFCDSAYQEYLDDNNFTIGRPPQSWCYVEEVKR